MKIRGLYKQCAHDKVDRCSCPWWGNYKGHRVSLRKWSGRKVNDKKAAAATYRRMQDAIDDGTFDPAGERRVRAFTRMTLSELLALYRERHLDARNLRSEAQDIYLRLLDAELGTFGVAQLAANPLVVQEWLSRKSRERSWSSGTFNRYYEFGRAVFNKAIRWKLVGDNPFHAFSAKREENYRPVRITPAEERRLLECCEFLRPPDPARKSKITAEIAEEIRARVERGETQKDIARVFGLSRSLVSQIVNRQVWNGLRKSSHVSSEMRRRVIGAIDLGLRAGEMLALQVKHVNCDTWIVHLPAAITKAKRDQVAFAMTPRVQEILRERRSLGQEAYVFGREDGRRVRSFDKTWVRLFRLAGLRVGRKDGVVWHDLRHEYGSYLADIGARIHELKDLMRHADISTTARYLAPDRERLRWLASKLTERHALPVEGNDQGSLP